MSKMLLPVKDKNPVKAIEGFFQTMLDKGLVDALLLPQETPSGENVLPTLVKSSKGVRAVDPFAPVVQVNAAGIMSKLTNVDAGKKIGALLRPCEISALIELVKLEQASLDNVLIIGIDCAGTFDPKDFSKLKKDGGFSTLKWLEKAAAGDDFSFSGMSIRPACKMCSRLTPENTQIRISWLGIDPLKELLVEFAEGQDQGSFDNLTSFNELADKRRESTLNSLKELRRREFEKEAGEIALKLGNQDSLLDLLAGCTGCHNCRRACPICFCRECVFDSPLFKHDSEKYFDWAAKKDLIRMPTDTLLYHMTRLNHMGLSCVGCGHCEIACPAGLPLASIFKTAGERAQEFFSYSPGQSVEDALPLTTYKESEFNSKKVQ